MCSAQRGLRGVATVAQPVRGLHAAERAAGRELVPFGGGHAPGTALRAVHAANVADAAGSARGMLPELLVCERPPIYLSAGQQVGPVRLARVRRPRAVVIAPEIDLDDVVKVAACCGRSVGLHPPRVHSPLAVNAHGLRLGAQHHPPPDEQMAVSLVVARDPTQRREHALVGADCGHPARRVWAGWGGEGRAHALAVAPLRKALHLEAHPLVVLGIGPPPSKQLGALASVFARPVRGVSLLELLEQRRGTFTRDPLGFFHPQPVLLVARFGLELLGGGRRLYAIDTAEQLSQLEHRRVHHGLKPAFPTARRQALQAIVLIVVVGGRPRTLLRSSAQGACPRAQEPRAKEGSDPARCVSTDTRFRVCDLPLGRRCIPLRLGC